MRLTGQLDTHLFQGFLRRPDPQSRQDVLCRPVQIYFAAVTYALNRLHNDMADAAAAEIKQDPVKRYRDPEENGMAPAISDFPE